MYLVSKLKTVLKIIAVTQANIDVFHNPSSLLSIFTNSLTNYVVKKIFRIKGIYIAGNGINYCGVYNWIYSLAPTANFNFFFTIDISLVQGIINT